MLIELNGILIDAAAHRPVLIREITAHGLHIRSLRGRSGIRNTGPATVTFRLIEPHRLLDIEIHPGGYLVVLDPGPGLQPFFAL